MFKTDRQFGFARPLAFLMMLAASTLHAADHLDAPALDGMGDLDINDLYAFQSPGNPDNTVLIMTVNPLAGVVSGTSFNTAASYDFHIDNTGDAIADVTYSASFIGGMGGQNISLTRNGMNLGSGAVGGSLALAGGGMLQAGVFDDPFFFDSAGFNNGFMFTGDDFFAGANVSAIILEVPSAELGPDNVGVWARTAVGGVQVDRIGRPAINTALIPGGPTGRKDEFNRGDPADDFATFGADVQAAIEGLNGGDATHASAVTSVLLPDVLTIDTSNPNGFLNGRGLADDVIDAELTLLTNSDPPIGDGVDANDLPFPGVFPYLAPAHVPEPNGIALVLLLMPLLGSLRRRT